MEKYRAGSQVRELLDDRASTMGASYTKEQGMLMLMFCTFFLLLGAIFLDRHLDLAKA